MQYNVQMDRVVSVVHSSAGKAFAVLDKTAWILYIAHASKISTGDNTVLRV